MAQSEAARHRPVKDARPGTAAAIGAVVIIFVFLWGISNQRDGRPASQPHQHRLRQLPRRESLSKVPRNRTTSLGSSSKGQAPTTTGQGSREQGEAEQKTNSGQPSNQQPTNAGQNAPPTENSEQQAQPR
jgi:hypothetical protein